MSAMRIGRSGPLLMVASAFSWAAGVVVTKLVLDRSDAPSTSVLAVQLGGSVLVLAFAALVMRTPLRGAWSKGWVGLLEPGIAYYLALAGLALTSATNASILGSLEPVLVPLLLLLLFRERPGARMVVVVIAATLGSVLVSASGSSGGSDWRGDLLIVGSVAAAALYVVLASAQVVELPPVAAALTQQVWAVGLVGATLAIGLAGAGTWDTPRMSDLVLMLASGVLNYALPFWLYLAALTRMPVARAAAYLTLIPPFGVLLAAAVLGEQVTVFHALGGALVVASLLYDALSRDAGRESMPDNAQPGTTCNSLTS
jgi:drug/metabolite transporter (DMT)-like permease